MASLRMLEGGFFFVEEGRRGGEEERRRGGVEMLKVEAFRC